MRICQTKVREAGTVLACHAGAGVIGVLAAPAGLTPYLLGGSGYEL